jgi:hypothetical protein
LGGITIKYVSYSETGTVEVPIRITAGAATYRAFRVAKLGSDYYSLKLTRGANSVWTIHKSSDITDSWATVHTITLTLTGGTGWYGIIKEYGTHLYVFVAETDGGGNYKFHIAESSDGSAWNDHEEAAYNRVANLHAYDTFFLGATQYLYAGDDDVGTATFFSVAYAAGVLTLTQQATNTDIEGARGVGQVDGSNYYFVTYDTVLKSRIQYFNGAAITDNSDQISTAVLSGINASLHIMTGGTRIFRAGNGLYRKEKGEWNLTTSGQIQAIYDTNYLLYGIGIINPATDTLYIYNLGVNGGFGLIHTATGLTDYYVPLGGCVEFVWITDDDPGVGVYKTYQAGTTSVSAQISKIHNEHYKAWSAELQLSSDDLTAGKYYILQTDGGTDIFKGTLQAYDVNTEQLIKPTIIHESKQDLSTAVHESYTAQTASYILEDIIKKYCLWLTPGTIDVTVTAYTIKFTGKSVRDCIKFLEVAETKRFYIDKDGSCNYDDGDVDSTITATDANTLRLVKRTIGSDINAVELQGGYVNGVQLTAYAKDDDPVQLNYGLFKDTYSEILDQTTLDALATEILANKQAYVKMTLTIKGEGNLQNGETINISSTNRSIAAADYIIEKVRYNYEVNETRIIAYSGLFFKDYFKTLPVQRLQRGTDDVRQLAGQNADNLYTNYITQTTLNTYFMIGTANAKKIPCILEWPYENNYDDIFALNGEIHNVGAADFNLSYKLPIPTTLGALKLYLKKITVRLSVADATDFITARNVYGITETGATNEYTSGTNLDSAIEHTSTFPAAIDASVYDVIAVIISATVATKSELVIASVELEVYYDT